MSEQQPTVGRAVHVRRYSDGAATTDCLAGTVARVWSPTVVNIGGFDADGHPFSSSSVGEDDGKATSGDRWHWPERV